MILRIYTQIEILKAKVSKSCYNLVFHFLNLLLIFKTVFCRNFHDLPDVGLKRLWLSFHEFFRVSWQSDISRSKSLRTSLAIAERTQWPQTRRK